MNDRDPGSLNLEHVVRRFAESEEALRQLESNIENLARLEETTEASTHALEESAAAVKEYAEKASQVTSDLARVAEEAGKLLTRARDVLDGSQLQQIEDSVSEGHEELRGALSRQGEKMEELGRSVERVGTSVSETGSTLVSELDQTEELESLRSLVEGVDGSVSELGSKLVSDFQKRLTSVEGTLTGGQKRLTWLLVVLVLLEAAVFGLVAFGGS